MIKSDELNQWIKRAREYCYGKRCYKCELGTDGPSGVECSWVKGSTTQEQVDMIAAYKPPVDWSKVPVDTKVIVWDVPEHKYRMYFAKYENGEIFTYMGGATSWSREPEQMSGWKYGRLAEDDE